MTSQAQAASPLPGFHGLVFLGFPLHPAGRPSDERGSHLFQVRIPMLFLQGTHDALADTKLLQGLVRRLGRLATLKLFQDADHSFHVPARSVSNADQFIIKFTSATGMAPVGMLRITILPSAWMTGPEEEHAQQKRRPPTTKLPLLSANDPLL